MRQPSAPSHTRVLDTIPRALFRFRWPLTSVLLAAAAMLAIDSITPATPPTGPVVVASQDLHAGDYLSAANTTVAQFPLDLVPDDAHTDPAIATGRAIIAPVARGTVLGSKIAPGSGSGPTGPEGTVVMPVRFADPATAALVSPGSFIDVLATSDEPRGGQAIVIAASAFVVAGGPPPTDGLLGATREDGPLLLAVTPSEAAGLAGAAGHSTFSIVILPTPN